MNFDKIGEQWSRVTFALDPDTPSDLRVDMFVRRNDQDGKERYDVGWAEEFKSEDSCSFKSLKQIEQETGLRFSEIGMDGDLSVIHVLSYMTRRDVVWLHSISRFWAIKNGLMNQIKEQKQHDKDEHYRVQHEREEEQQREALMAAKERALNEKIKKLEKMTFKVLKQNVTIYKTIKKQEQQDEQGGGKTLLDKLLK